MSKFLPFARLNSLFKTPFCCTVAYTPLFRLSWLVVWYSFPSIIVVNLLVNLGSAPILTLVFLSIILFVLESLISNVALIGFCHVFLSSLNFFCSGKLSSCNLIIVRDEQQTYPHQIENYKELLDTIKETY